MSVNLLDNAKKALTGYPIDQLVAWTDSSNALHCIRGNDNYKQFVKNRADKIREKKEIAWRYVNTNEILADIGSRGMSVAKMGELRWKGPGWLRDSDNWSSNIKTKATAETEKEARIIKVMKTSTTLKSDIMDKILLRFSYWKFLRMTSWIQRFLHNYKRLKSEKQSWLLTTKGIESSEIFWVEAIQTKIQDTPQFKNEDEKLNLQLDETNTIYICKGRITGDYPIYISSNTLMREKLTAHAHFKILRVGVGYTIAEVNKRFWIPKLRQLAKRVIHKCYECKRF